MVMKVYGDEMSVCVARVLLCLHEKNTEFELVPVDLFACHHKLPSFLSMNVRVFLLNTLLIYYHAHKYVDTLLSGPYVLLYMSVSKHICSLRCSPLAKFLFYKTTTLPFLVRIKIS